jgi:ribosome-associated protein
MPKSRKEPLLPPPQELEEEMIRPASGPGGQHVNRTACAVRLVYHFKDSLLLRPEAQERLRALCGSKIVGDTLVLVAKEYRSLEDNRRAARERLSSFIEAARKIPKKRRATKPTRSSKERRLHSKSVRSETKRLRGSDFE